eukprot:CAMPEP_0178982898 /NCGR_PEP_ID=MMETSP0795-20121207/751_1 /TAXON_ID=88552 /ORGANISM="Amoebophrya sp., Strain Ameob2" /LENGTH=130 /DNA_ID=CAMNT_0020673593 /DNA_START=996 /DNA_END=1388 /DNA_ORIENTATION=+
MVVALLVPQHRRIACDLGRRSSSAASPIPPSHLLVRGALRPQCGQDEIHHRALQPRGAVPHIVLMQCEHVVSGTLEHAVAVVTAVLRAPVVASLIVLSTTAQRPNVPGEDAHFCLLAKKCRGNHHQPAIV